MSSMIQGLSPFIPFVRTLFHLPVETTQTNLKLKTRISSIFRLFARNFFHLPVKKTQKHRILGPPKKVRPGVKAAFRLMVQKNHQEFHSPRKQFKAHAAFFLIVATGGLFFIPLGAAIYFKNKRISIKQGKTYPFSRFFKELFEPGILKNRIIWLSGGAAAGRAGGPTTGSTPSAGMAIPARKKNTWFQGWKLRVMDEKVKKDFTDYISSKKGMEDFVCPITGELFEKPVRAPDDIVYDEKGIIQWIKEKTKDVSASINSVVDFTVDDLVVDYHTCINQSKMLLKLYMEDSGTTRQVRVKSGFVNLRFDLLNEIGTCLEKWMVNLAKMRKQKNSSLETLLNKYARLCVEVEITPEKMTGKCQAILGSEWDARASAYLKHVYDNREPSHIFEQSCDYKFNAD